MSISYSNISDIPSFVPELSVIVNNSGVVASFNAWNEDEDEGDPPTAYRLEYKHDESDIWETLPEIDGEQQGNVTVIVGHLEESGDYTMRVIPIMEHEGTVYEGEGSDASFVYSIEKQNRK